MDGSPVWHELYVLMSSTPRGIEINFSIWASDSGEGRKKKRNWNLILFVNVLSSGKERKKKQLLNENMPRKIRMMVLVLLKIAQGSSGRGFFVFLVHLLFSCVPYGQKVVGATGLRDWAKSGLGFFVFFPPIVPPSPPPAPIRNNSCIRLAGAERQISSSLSWAVESRRHSL